MKIEMVDIVCIFVALFFLAAYIKLQNVVFLLITVILLAGVAFFQLKDIKIRVRETKVEEEPPKAQ